MTAWGTVTLSVADAGGLLELARYAVRHLDRDLTRDERRGLEALEFALERKDRRHFNRFTQVPTAAPARGRDLRRRPRA